MKTLDLLEAAVFLRMHPETLRRQAVAGVIPSAKPGKHWLFIDEDLANWIRERYADRARAAEPDEVSACSTADRTVIFGGFGSPHQTAKKYDAVLARRTKKRPKNTKQS
ncbi:helix-turn-helix domain-containing protein [uncultured Thiocystis sp.]|jgi:excisionase family DNA binding protein|uniref:helix-turn-helix domain-containing protein n=1 Tax=uncultured Thiocystis sp. TaxID=1202134 RepID=UPI00341B2EB1